MKGGICVLTSLDGGMWVEDPDASRMLRVTVDIPLFQSERYSLNFIILISN